MKIENDLKLDFSDVLIRPKRSTLSSRSDVNLIKDINAFKYSTQNWSGIPIICSNMDTIATIDMYKSLSQYKIITCFHKKIDVQEIIDEKCDPNYFMLSTGIKDTDFELLKLNVSTLNDANITIKFICIDVANGYMFSLIDFCKRFVKNFLTPLL